MRSKRQRDTNGLTRSEVRFNVSRSPHVGHTKLDLVKCTHHDSSPYDASHVLDFFGEPRQTVPVLRGILCVKVGKEEEEVADDRQKRQDIEGDGDKLRARSGTHGVFGVKKKKSAVQKQLKIYIYIYIYIQTIPMVWEEK